MSYDAEWLERFCDLAIDLAALGGAALTWTKGAARFCCKYAGMSEKETSRALLGREDPLSLG